MQALKIVIGMSVAVGIFAGAFSYSFAANDQISCHQWAQQAKEYRLFYLTPSEKDQCNFFTSTLMHQPMSRFLYSEGQTRAWLQIRIECFQPRIKKVKKTKAAPYAFTLEELATDMRRTLVELEERIAQKPV